MSPTATERRIIQRRKAKGILTPILEEVLDSQLDLEDDKDQWFMIELMKARARQREKGVFSPSMLSSCERQAYFVKTGVEKQPPANPRAHAYFLDGDFRHYKWQFATWKAHRAGLLKLLGCEIRIFHPDGEFAGTVDVALKVPQFPDEIFIADYKGMNAHAFQSHEKYGTKAGYIVQIVGYAEIVNKACAFESFMGSYLGVKVDRVLLVGENKNGPVQAGSPIALHEDVLEVDKHRSKVKRRMHRLRRFAREEITPEPSCTSLRTFQFQECPFSRFCREEVKEIQRQRENNARSNAKEPKVKTSTRSRTHRSSRSTGGRKKRSS